MTTTCSSVNRLSAQLLAVSGLLAALLAGCSNKGPMETLPPPQTYPPSQYKAGMTWYHDVQPVVQAHCQSCHVTGGIGPFPITTYDEAVKVHPSMSIAVQGRTMPPWMPSDNCQSLRDSRRLAQDDIDTIYSWSKDGAPAGDPSSAPPPPPPSQGLAWVDRTLDPGADYTPNMALSDDYHCFLLDPQLVQDQDLIGFDLAPMSRQEVHHVLVFSADMAMASAVDGNDAALGWTCFGGAGVQNAQLIAAWVPGSPATTYPQGTGIPLKAGSALVMQIHYNLSHGATPDRTGLKLQLAKTPVPLKAIITPTLNVTFAIPPNSTGYSATATSAKLPTDLTLWGTTPHMHTLGRHINVSADDGTCLIDIPKWDFHWQQMYFFASPNGMRLKKGQNATVTCVWDNPTDNTVRFGEGTSDEMCLNYFYLTL